MITIPEAYSNDYTPLPSMHTGDLRKGRMSSGIAGSYLTCPLFCKRYYVDKLRPVSNPSPDSSPISPTYFGTTMHAALHAYQVALFEEEGEKAARIAAVEVWKNHFPSQSYSDYYTQERGISILLDRIELGWEGVEFLQLEVEFAIPLESCSLSLTGRLDAVVEVEGELWVLDYKTSKYISPDEARWRPNLALDTYAFACRALLGSCAGVMVDLIGVGKTHRAGRYLTITSRRTNYELDMVEKLHLIVGPSVECLYKLRGQTSQNPLHNPQACFDFGQSCVYRDLCMYGPSALSLYKEEKEDETSKAE